jgi:hypothetical protein
MTVCLPIVDGGKVSILLRLFYRPDSMSRLACMHKDYVGCKCKAAPGRAPRHGPGPFP